MPEHDRNVRLDGLWRDVASLWWVVLLVTVLVVGLAMARSTSSPDRYESNALVFLGQPLGPTGVQLQTISSSATTALELARSDEAVSKAAKEAGTSRAAVRSGLSVTPVRSPLASKLQNPPALVRVTVRNPDADAAKAAAQGISEFLVEHTGDRLGAKRTALEQRVESLEAAVASLRQQRTETIRRARGADAAVLALLAGSLRTDLHLTESELRRAQAELEASREIEQSRIVAEPGSIKLTSRSPRGTLMSAAFIGLVLGAVAAFAIARLRRGRRHTD